MTRLIKLTDADGYTRRGMYRETLWLPVGTVPPKLDGMHLCGSGVYHAYTSLEQAALMDPAHARLLPAGKAWWADGEVVVYDGTRVGCHLLVLAEPAELPELTTEVRVRTAICLVQAVLEPGRIPRWDNWAEAWLSDRNRDKGAARVAARAAWAARTARVARAAEAAGATEAAGAAVWAAWAAEGVGALDITAAVQRAIREEKEVSDDTE
jgi:hypothetical protein